MRRGTQSAAGWMRPMMSQAAEDCQGSYRRIVATCSPLLAVLPFLACTYTDFGRLQDGLCLFTTSAERAQTVKKLVALRFRTSALEHQPFLTFLLASHKAQNLWTKGGQLSFLISPFISAPLAVIPVVAHRLLPTARLGACSQQAHTAERPVQ